MRSNFTNFRSRQVMILSLFAVLFMIPSGAFAQNPVNFSGTWALNESKSNLGEGGSRMVSQKIVIVQDAATLSLARTFTTQDGDREMKESYTLDGKESVNPIFNTSKKSIAKWSDDKKTLTVSSVMVFEANGENIEIKTTEVYTLAGSVLTINSTSVSSRGERKGTLIYDKK